MHATDEVASPVLILGGSGGVGSRLVERLAKAGRPIIAAGRSADSLDALAARADVRTEVVDARSFDDVDRLVDSVGPISGAVNCVGSMLIKAAHQTSEREFDEAIAQNTKSAFALVRAAARTMRKSGGSIVLVSSCAAATGLPNHEAIAAAKGAIDGLVRSAAATYAANAIRVNAVAPGLTRTPLTRRITENERALEASVAMHPLGRIGEADDVAAAIEWLLDSSSGWITGQVVGVDGGLAAARPRPRA